MSLKLDWCSNDAAKYAVEHWHYSKSLPPFPHMRVGVWEDGIFKGVILFARGANKDLMAPYGLKSIEGCELVRVALKEHKAPVSKLLSIAVKMLKKSSKGLRLIVSFADTFQGHHGGIYQAANWIYAGMSAPSIMYKDKNDKLWHPRLISKSGKKKAFGKYRSVLTPDECKKISVPGKHRYLMPLDPEIRSRIEPLSKPYPKRASSVEATHLPILVEKGGAVPTDALQSFIKPEL